MLPPLTKNFLVCLTLTIFMQISSLHDNLVVDGRRHIGDKGGA